MKTRFWLIAIIAVIIVTSILTRSISTAVEAHTQYVLNTEKSIRYQGFVGEVIYDKGTATIYLRDTKDPVVTYMLSTADGTVLSKNDSYSEALTLKDRYPQLTIGTEYVIQTDGNGKFLNSWEVAKR